MEYLKSVLNNNQEQEIKNLKILIQKGKVLKKDVAKYEKELAKYNGGISKYNKKIEPIKIVESKPKKEIITKKTTKVEDNKLDLNSSKYSIKSVISEDNMIIIDFYKKIDKSYVDFSENRVKNGYQDIYDIRGNFKDAHPTKLSIRGVKQIVIRQENPKTLRILFEDRKNLKTIYILLDKRLIIKVLDIKDNNKINKPAVTLTKSQKVINNSKNKVIVIDPGHGGKDPGAVGGKDGKLYEKVAVFRVSKYLEDILKKRGYKVYLTRNSDKYIKVNNRTVLANDKNADIFISIHANAVSKDKANKIKGVETFFLSPARSERAKRVAALENKADIRTMSGSTKQAFLESLNRPRITASHKLSIDIQRNMLYSARKVYKDVEDGGVREGPFWVLVGAQMPSVLIEIGYITHPIEGRRMFRTAYQKSLASGIANGIDAYFAKNP